MSKKYTPLSAQNELTSKIERFHERAAEVKRGYQILRQEILQNDRLSSTAKDSDLADLAIKTSEQISAIKAEQDSYVTGLKSTLEKELLGNQPMDADSVMLRRDAADRARKITDQSEALAVLNDAIRNSDEHMAHAIGTRARNHAWLDVADAWKGAYPETADSAEALSFVEGATSDGAFNLANQITYSAPTT